MSKQQIGVIGLAVMGKNIAFNIESRGYKVSVYNRTPERTKQMMEEATEKEVYPYYTIKDFVASLEKPRKILLMVAAGKATDKTIDQLLPHLDQGDLIIDGGNTNFVDTQRRSKYLLEKGIHFIGMGVSGGEEGALNGPSLMPGGKREAHQLIRPILEKIAAKVEGEPCTTYIGPDGAGHFVKMVHNGIEYGDMQLIAETYAIMKHILGLDADMLHRVFSEWNKGELDSYLIEITADIFAKKDEETGEPLVEKVLDTAEQKGTGKWTSINALDLGVPLPVITESVFARFMSALKRERVAASQVLTGPQMKRVQENLEEWIEAIRQALYMGKICSYAQGFSQMKAASEKYNWHLDYGSIAMIFRGGCIIRAAFLQKIKEAYDRDPNLANLLLDEHFRKITDQYQQSLRQVVSLAVENGIPVPGLSAAIAYYDSYRTERLPANLLQAQRDYFGAHTYQRIDQEGIFHTDWTS